MFKYNKIAIVAILALVLVICASTPALAAEKGPFGELISAGRDIFTGLREIIYPASAVGIIAVCMGGFFGNINWKWLTAIVVGLVVISCCVMFVEMFAPEAVKSIPKDIMSGK